MDNEIKTSTRKNGRHLRVPVLSDEETEIKSNAAKAGLSIAEYLRRVGLGYSIQSMVDKESVLQLSKINADIGRLGGLLKLWLTQDQRVAHFHYREIKVLLDGIKMMQEAMFGLVKKL